MGNQPTRNGGASSLPIDAVKVARLGEAIAPEFAYCVELGESGERRSAKRRRTRLRSGKILDLHNGFLIECQIYDRSNNGARVRLLADVSAPVAIRLYEDCPERLLDARVVWRRDHEIGLRFIERPGPRRLSRTQLTCLRGRYYALDH